MYTLIRNIFMTCAKHLRKYKRKSVNKSVTLSFRVQRSKTQEVKKSEEEEEEKVGN